MVATERNCPNITQAGHSDRHRRTESCSAANLPIAIVSPAQDRSCRQQCAGVKTARCDSDNTSQPRNRNCGVRALRLIASPSWPWLFNPQHSTVPCEVKAQQ